MIHKTPKHRVFAYLHNNLVFAEEMEDNEITMSIEDAIELYDILASDLKEPKWADVPCVEDETK